VLTKKAFEEGGFDILEVKVDGPTARENVTRFATHGGYAAEAVDGEGGSSTIRIRPSAASAAASASTNAPAGTPAPEPSPLGASGGAVADTLFVSSDKIGSGADELGELLMRGFIKTLLEAKSLPRRIIFMNSGVRLAVEGSPSVESLRDLASRGVEVLACGTCLDYYSLKDKLAVGRVSNMFEISGFLLEGRTLSL
jgi:selenium metabolism protein YedF